MDLRAKKSNMEYMKIVDAAAAWNLSVRRVQIAERMHLSMASVKQIVRTAIYKTGVENKAALAFLL